MLKIQEVRCCGLTNPVGLDTTIPDFSWKLESDQQDNVQKSYCLTVADAASGKVVWDSGCQESAGQTAIVYEGPDLDTNHAYCFTVTVADDHGETAVSEGNTFTIGIRQDEWKAKWIGVQPEDLDPDVQMVSKEQMVKDFVASMNGEGFSKNAIRNLEPCNIYRREFTVESLPETAYLSVTAHGIYEARINGENVTDARLTPGFTAYDEYLEYQTYEVTSLLKEGTNVLTITLSDGWYRGTFGILGYGNNYGVELAALAQLEMDQADGTKDYIVTDESFQYTQSSIRYADIMIGEKQDGRIDDSVLYEAGADMSGAKCAAAKDYGYDNLHGISCERDTCTQILDAKEIITTPKGETIVDLGQVMVGYIRLEVEGEAGTEVKLEYTEVLDKEGNFINNVSGVNRDQTDYYIVGGNGTEYFEPKFTFHGFRYVKISGYPGELTTDKVKGIVLGAALEKSGTFACSDPMLNQLQSNIQWGERGNMLSIPTDCPQRERAGWTGDIYIFVRTACYNLNVNKFLQKWLKNVAIEQFDDGLVPVIVPYPLGYNAMQKDAFGTDTSAGWGDAAIKVPWVLYQVYGDKRILESNFDMMKKWMDYEEADASQNMPELPEDASPEQIERQKYLWNTNFHFGDWCYPSCKNEKGETDMFRSAYTTKEHVATAMYAASTDMMSQVCQVLGKDDLSAYYKDLNAKIRQAFADEYVNEDGSIDGAVQGIYVLAIAMDMVNEDQKAKMAEYLVQMIHDNDDCLDTGFLSVEHLLDVLVDTGHSDVARTILYQTKCPSWLYEVKNGATTIWESWNAIMEDGTRTTDSYNHYAIGCVGNWMYRTIAGIRLLEPGYKKFRIAPSFDYGLTEASGSYDCVYGTIRSEWTLDGNEGKLKVEVPVGTTAQICLPGIDEEVGSGKYEYTFTLD